MSRFKFWGIVSFLFFLLFIAPVMTVAILTGSFSYWWYAWQIPGGLLSGVLVALLGLRFGIFS
jgi:uncharacterized membrane protein